MSTLPASTRPGRVRLRVADLERSLDWYRDLLGFRVAERAPGRVGLGAADGPALVELNETPGARPAARRAPSLYHFAVLLPDRAALGRILRRLLDAGVRPGSADHLVSEALYIDDPDGLGIELYADRPRADWPRRGDRIAMDSLPLDARSLLREAGDAAWNGMPAGATIGHVHLHVPDIAEADAFYRGALGFDVTAALPGALFLSAGGYHHHLGLNTWAPPGRLPADDEAALLDWELLLPESADTADRLAQAGAELRHTDEAVEVEDPFGLRLRLRVVPD